MNAGKTQRHQAREFHIVAGLSTDDPRWRMKGVASVLLASAAGAAARRSDGPARIILALVAAVLLLPALSLASMSGIALLLQRLERQHAEDA